MSLSYSQAVVILRNLGFRVRTTGEAKQAVASFQLGYNLGAWLAVDGVRGPATDAALVRSESRRRVGAGTASSHFSFTEFRCSCGGAYSGCRVILVNRALLQSLEKYRAKAGPTTIVSGYRCPTRNRIVGGATNSQHMYGSAADLNYRLTDNQVLALRAFAGIGRSASTHLVRHADRRDVSGHNNGGTLSHPVIWNYSS